MDGEGNMNKLIALIVASAALAYVSVANAGYKEFREDVLNDKSLSPTTKTELKDYFDKEEAMFKAQKLERKQIKDKLSPEAKKVIYKHRKNRRKSRAMQHKKMLDKSEVKQ